MTDIPINKRQRMTWAQAVEAMKRGAIVRRACDCYSILVDEGDPDSDDIRRFPVYESGQEGCFLAHAWTVDEKPALVFMGVSSKCLFVPEFEHTSAVDWVEITKQES